MNVAEALKTINVAGRDRLFVGAGWVKPSREADMDRAVAAGRRPFENSPWPRRSHAVRAAWLTWLAGTVSQNGDRIAFGGCRQSGLERERGREGLPPYLESKTPMLDA